MYKLLFLIILVSCSWTRKQGVNVLAPALRDGVSEIYTIDNWQYFKEAAPSNILFIESLMATSPKNETLVSQAMKAHFGYGYGVYETLALDEVYTEADHTPNKDQALYHYTKAINYGKKYLHLNGLEFSKLKKLTLAPQKIRDELDSEFGKSDTLPIFYFGAALSSSLNFQKSRADLLTLVPMAKAFIDWACEKEPSLEHGLCTIFQGVYLMSRPKMLGGNPKKGVSMLERMNAKNPNNLLSLVKILQYRTIPGSDLKSFKKYSSKMTSQIQRIKRNSLEFVKDKAPDYTALFNQIAIKRLNIMKKRQKSIFY